MGSEPATQSRRAFIKGGMVLGAALVAPGCTQRAIEVATQPQPIPPPPYAPPPAPVAVAQKHIAVRQPLLDRAKAALDQHKFEKRDRIVLADFSAPSSQTRLHLVNLEEGTTRVLLVSHGSGSDPSHTGFLQRFSNEDGSNASSEGAYLTSDYYFGQHGRSQRLIGLDPTNSNALSRAIVIHGAWYAERDIISQHGKLGRSQGCFAVGQSELQTLFDTLGQSRLLYAAKV